MNNIFASKMQKIISFFITLAAIVITIVIMNIGLLIAKRWLNDTTYFIMLIVLILITVGILFYITMFDD